MSQNKVIETFRSKNRERLAEIVQAENGRYQLWKIARRDIHPTGNKHSLIDEYEELVAAQAEARMILNRHEEDQK